MRYKISFLFFWVILLNLSAQNFQTEYHVNYEKLENDDIHYICKNRNDTFLTIPEQVNKSVYHNTVLLNNSITQDNFRNIVLQYFNKILDSTCIILTSSFGGCEDMEVVSKLALDKIINEQITQYVEDSITGDMYEQTVDMKHYNTDSIDYIDVWYNMFYNISNHDMELDVYAISLMIEVYDEKGIFKGNRELLVLDLENRFKSLGSEECFTGLGLNKILNENYIWIQNSTFPIGINGLSPHNKVLHNFAHYGVSPKSVKTINNKSLPHILFDECKRGALNYRTLEGMLGDESVLNKAKYTNVNWQVDSNNNKSSGGIMGYYIMDKFDPEENLRNDFKIKIDWLFKDGQLSGKVKEITLTERDLDYHNNTTEIFVKDFITIPF